METCVCKAPGPSASCVPGRGFPRTWRGRGERPEAPPRRAPRALSAVPRVLLPLDHQPGPDLAPCHPPSPCRAVPRGTRGSGQGWGEAPERASPGSCRGRGSRGGLGAWEGLRLGGNGTEGREVGESSGASTVSPGSRVPSVRGVSGASGRGPQRERCHPHGILQGPRADPGARIGSPTGARGRAAVTASCQVFPRVGPGGGWLDGGGGLFSPALELPLGPQHQTLGRLWSPHLPWSYFHSPKRSTLWAGGPGARWSRMSIYCSDFPAQESPSRVGCDPGSDPGHSPCVASRGFLPLWLQSPQRRRGRSQQWQPLDLVKRTGVGVGWG